MQSLWKHLSFPRLLRVLVSSTVAAMVVASSSGTVLAQSSTPESASCNVEQAASVAPIVYTIDSEQSTVSVAFTEELASADVPAIVATSHSLVGSVLFGADGSPLVCSNFALDLRTLVSGDDLAQLQIPATEAYPFATFVVTRIEGHDGPIAEDEPAKLDLTGDLTIRGLTKTMTWDVEIARGASILTGTATAIWATQDFGIGLSETPQGVVIPDELVVTIDVVAMVDATTGQPVG